MKIEIHTLQSFPPSNLNRDDSGMPKDCEFGGYRRARISSQCLKRSIRFSDSFSKRMDNNIGVRTKNALKKLIEQITKFDIDEENADMIARSVLESAIGNIDDKDKTSTLFYTDDTELGNLAKVVSSHFDKIIEFHNSIENETVKKKKDSLRKELDGYIKKITKEFFDTYANKIDSVDIALFGRMLAHTPTMNIHASCQVAHAISTNKISMDFDYFTAVDDLNPGGETGAGMIGSTAFNSACYYRYSVIDFEQLMSNLGNKKELAVQGILGFLEGSVFAVPSGKINAFAHDTQPEFIMIVARKDDAPANLANAFEKPVYPDKDNSLMQNSVAAIDEHWNSLSEMYGFDENNRVFVCTKHKDNLSKLKDTGSFKDILEKIEEYINANMKEA